jgi:two-component system, OmpR family, response regulator
LVPAVPPSPKARFATPTATLATLRLASAAANPTRAGAVAADTMLLARFILRVYSRFDPVKLHTCKPGADSWQTITRLLALSFQELHKLYQGNVQVRDRRNLMTSATSSETKPEARVLVVDDEANIVELLSVSLKFQGFEVYTATNGAQALDRAREARPDAVILDVMMPGMDGFGVLRRLRADGIDAPALFLTARDSLQDKIAGLTLGGDDYVTKPFSLEEVVARLRVILRRTGKGGAEPRSARLTFADIELDEETHEVWKAGHPVSLSPTEFTLLRYFVINAGTVLSKPKILDHVWRYDFGGDVNVVESYVSYLRRKIDTGEKRLLHTLRGVGYVLREPR